MSHNPEDDLGGDTAEELEALYPPDYLRSCADGKAREERLQELRRRIELQLYDVDSQSIAEGLLAHGDLSQVSED